MRLLEQEQVQESGASMKAAEALLGEIGKNTSNLTELQDRLEYKVSKHVDVREALLKKKDDELHNLQMKMNERMESEADEQQKLRDLIASLEKQLRERDSDLKEREKKLSSQKDHLQSERRKFETEKEITFANLQREKEALMLKEKSFDKEKSDFRSAMELEHRNIISKKMRIAVSQNTDSNAADSNNVMCNLNENESTPFPQNELVRIEMNALAEAFKCEESKLKKQKELLIRKEEKLNQRRQKFSEKEKVNEIIIYVRLFIFTLYTSNIVQ